VLKTRFAPAVLAMLAAQPAFAQQEALQVIAPGEAPIKSTSDKQIRNNMDEAEAAALLNAWIVIKRHPDVALKVRNLTGEQNAKLAEGLKQRCQATLLNYDADKKLRKLSARYRFDCNLLDIQTDIDRVIRTAGPAVDGPARPRLASFFIVQEVLNQTTRDDDNDHKASAMARQGVTSATKGTTSYSSDDRRKVTVSEGYGDGGGAANDSVSIRDQNKGRGRTSTTDSSDVTARVETASKSSGRTITFAVDQKYRPASPELLNAALTDVFKNGRTKINHYGDIFSQCPGPNPDQVTSQYGRSREDLSTPVRTGILNAVRKCQFKYMLLGDALIDTTQSDPATGQPKVSVVLTAKVWDISDNFPEVVATVQKTGTASNSNFNIAKSDAMFQASQRVGEEVLSRLSAEGVR